jgi:Zn-dependent protease with chaperone function
MNFVRHQARAERAGRRLLGLHALATVVVIFAVDALATLLWHLLFGITAEPPRGFHATNVGIVLLLVVGGGWLETARLREDGAIIAHRLGAVAADPATDVLHRRLQNLLEELAIVARIGVPRAFVLEDEPTINALTAGMDRNHAIVVVTRGALERLTRDELQGVLAHEVSHVVNGDVRLNTRLIGMNHGLQWVSLAGRSLLCAAQRRAHGLGPLGLALAAPMALAGAVLRVVGEVGAIAARAIQAGIGRQREYFADAQAIAFTRSRDGLGGALRKVAGQGAVLRREAQAAGAAPLDPRRAAAVRHPYWQNVAHLLLSGMVSSRRWFETHPPLRERVRRLYGRAMPPIEPAALAEPERDEPELPALRFAVADEDGDAIDAATGSSLAAAAALAATAASRPRRAWSDAVPGDRSGGAPGTGHAAPVFAPGVLPGSALIDGVRASASVRLVQATRAPAGAAALVVALVESPGQPAPGWDAGWSAAAARLPALRESLAMMPPEAVHSLRWPLMELAAARLRPLSRPSRDALLATVRGIVEADGRVTLREWIHFGLLRLRLAPQPDAPRFPGLADPADARCVRVLFALVAQCAQVSEAKADRAANAAIRALELAPIGGSAGPLTLDALDGAVRRAARLPPLDRPLLVRRLAAMLPPDAGAEVRDFLRLLCVAIDCPAPRLPPRGPAPRLQDVDEPADVEA